MCSHKSKTVLPRLFIIIRTILKFANSHCKWGVFFRGSSSGRASNGCRTFPDCKLSLYLSDTSAHLEIKCWKCIPWVSLSTWDEIYISKTKQGVRRRSWWNMETSPCWKGYRRGDLPCNALKWCMLCLKCTYPSLPVCSAQGSGDPEQLWKIPLCHMPFSDTSETSPDQLLLTIAVQYSTKSHRAGNRWPEHFLELTLGRQPQIIGSNGWINS